MNLKKLRKLQEDMAKSVILKDAYTVGEIEYVLGVDQAFSNDTVFSACVLLSFPELEVVDSSISVAKATVPYIPTYLMFREGKPAVEAVKKVIKDRCVVMVDGSGIAHPRRCGLATYIGLELDVPSLGITKKKLYGSVKEPEEVMESSPIYDGDQIIGFAIKTCKRCRSIYVSPGHLITPETALKIVKMCTKSHKLPEPVRLADKFASRAKLNQSFQV